jgi:hypothetical protein
MKGTGVEVDLAVPVPVVADVAPTVSAKGAGAEGIRELLNPEEGVLGMLDCLAAVLASCCCGHDRRGAGSGRRES